MPKVARATDMQCLQVHIRHAGQSKMLFNKFKLQGIAPKIQKLAKREGEVSNVTTKETHLPVVRHAQAVDTALPNISDDEEVQLSAVSFEAAPATTRPAQAP